MKIDKLDELNELFRLILSRANSMNGAAKLSKVAQSTLSDWGTGKTVPGLKNYIQLCRSLGCRPGKELDNFLGLAENPPQTAEDLLGVALSLSEAEQQKLIYLIAFRFSNILKCLMIEQSSPCACLFSLFELTFASNQIKTDVSN